MEVFWSLMGNGHIRYFCLGVRSKDKKKGFTGPPWPGVPGVRVPITPPGRKVKAEARARNVS